MSKFTVVYDACVLYPAPLRDLLMNLALTNLFKAHWTDRIHDEWINALMRENRFAREKLEHVCDLMDRHAGDAKITGYETQIRDPIWHPAQTAMLVTTIAPKENACH